MKAACPTQPVSLTSNPQAIMQRQQHRKALLDGLSSIVPRNTRSSQGAELAEWSRRALLLSSVLAASGLAAADGSSAAALEGGPQMEPAIALGLQSALAAFMQPEPVGVPRRRLGLNFAVLLMRSCYDAVDDLDCTPMVRTGDCCWAQRGLGTARSWPARPNPRPARSAPREQDSGQAQGWRWGRAPSAARSCPLTPRGATRCHTMCAGRVSETVLEAEAGRVAALHAAKLAAENRAGGITQTLPHRTLASVARPA
jgi:hypothetical protein